MTKQKDIEEGIEIILFDNSIKGPKYQKNFTELAKDIVRMESDKGVVIKVDRELPCTRCKGSGLIEVGVLRGGVFRGNNIDCPDCNGKGKRAGSLAVEPLIEEE